MVLNLKAKKKIEKILQPPPPPGPTCAFFPPSWLAERSNPDIDAWCRKQTLKDARHSSAVIMGFSIPKQKSYQNLHLFHLSLQQRVHANRKKKEEQDKKQPYCPTS